MPLADFLNETIEILKTQPNVTETIVERLKPLRYAAESEAGQEKYRAFFQSFNSGPPVP